MRQLLFFAALAVLLASPALRADQGALAGQRHRVFVSTDVGGTDFDDFQSMVHVLLYADVLDIEGFISSPCGGPGRLEHLWKVIDLYATDYPKLRTYSARYPTPEALRAMSRQGETRTAPYAGVRAATAGSDWLVQCARRDDPRPLHVLIWGGIEDLAQALHDAPDILPKLRVYYIGGPNKKWSPDAYHYIATHHPKLWIIESNSTYYGWFVGGNQTGDLSAERFAEAHAAGRGALGEFFAHGISFEGQKRSSLKMGDTPSVAWLLRGDPAQPSQPGWGGRYVRAWARPHVRFERLTTAADTIEQCGILELMLPLGDNAPAQPEARMVIENQSLVGHVAGDGTMRFRFCPKEAKLYRYTIRGNVPALQGRAGQITSTAPTLAQTLNPSPELPNWWTDDPAAALIESAHQGARTINEWRADYLRDFAIRLERCRISKS
ncbi:MAG TPA: nucleoside hydrolase-like domain-containing protein [Acidobacteriota bacterium]|nr:nucleoside hydrolase-like domain-containing protein [Acidobacteriota bacterium]